MQVRRVRVQIDTARHRIVGTLQLPFEGYRSRTTDFLNAHDTGFIALTDVQVAAAGAAAAERREFVAVGCRHIAVLAEIEDLGVIDDDAPRLPGLTSPSTPPPGAD